MEIYVVRPGDTIDSIAASTSADTASLIYYNQLAYPYALAIGQALLIPVPGENPSRYPAYTNGYAYPFISDDTLEETLPYLSALSVFSYGFTEEGALLPPALDDSFMIEASVSAGTSPVLTLTPLGPDGLFNNNLITAWVNNISCPQTASPLLILFPSPGRPFPPTAILFLLPWRLKPRMTRQASFMPARIMVFWGRLLTVCCL